MDFLIFSICSEKVWVFVWIQWRCIADMTMLSRQSASVLHLSFEAIDGDRTTHGFRRNARRSFESPQRNRLRNVVREVPFQPGRIGITPPQFGFHKRCHTRSGEVHSPNHPTEARNEVRLLRTVGWNVLDTFWVETWPSQSVFDSQYIEWLCGREVVNSGNLISACSRLSIHWIFVIRTGCRKDPFCPEFLDKVKLFVKVWYLLRRPYVFN
jgi:hypothetical protein